MACLVRMRDEVLLLHNWDSNYLLCSRIQLLIALALDELTVGTAIFSLRLLTNIVLEATNNSVCIQRRSKLNRWKRTLSQDL